MTAAARRRPKRPKVIVAPRFPQQQQRHPDLEPQQQPIVESSFWHLEYWSTTTTSLSPLHTASRKSCLASTRRDFLKSGQTAFLSYFTILHWNHASERLCGFMTGFTSEQKGFLESCLCLVFFNKGKKGVRKGWREFERAWNFLCFLTMNIMSLKEKLQLCGHFNIFCNIW